MHRPAAVRGNHLRTRGAGDGVRGGGVRGDGGDEIARLKRELAEQVQKLRDMRRRKDAERGGGRDLPGVCHACLCLL